MLDFELLPVLSSLIAGELAGARRISALDPIFQELEPETEFGKGALGTDSLDLLNLAGAITEMFHLHETGVEEYLLRYRTLENWCDIVRVSLNKKAERITFRTSGSTGAPKRCAHLVERLEAEAVGHAETLSGCRRVLSMVPTHHIYGFIWAALLSAQLRIPVLDARRWTPSRVVREAREGDLLVGVPANWQLLVRNIDLVSGGILGVTSGAVCPESLFESVTRAGIGFREVYGSSETAGVGVRHQAGEPFNLLRHWRTGDPELSPPDRLVWQTERTFYVGGREDGAVQVAGKNVFPARVAEVLRSFPGIEECSVRMTRPEEGNRLKAFVVWRAGHFDQERSERGLRDWLASQLQPHEQPVSFTFGAAAPVNDMNKFTDWTIAC